MRLEKKRITPGNSILMYFTKTWPGLRQSEAAFSRPGFLSLTAVDILGR